MHRRRRRRRSVPRVSVGRGAALPTFNPGGEVMEAALRAVPVAGPALASSGPIRWPGVASSVVCSVTRVRRWGIAAVSPSIAVIIPTIVTATSIGAAAAIPVVGRRCCSARWESSTTSEIARVHGLCSGRKRAALEAFAPRCIIVSTAAGAHPVSWPEVGHQGGFLLFSVWVWRATFVATQSTREVVRAALVVWTIPVTLSACGGRRHGVRVGVAILPASFVIIAVPRTRPGAVPSWDPTRWRL